MTLFLIVEISEFTLSLGSNPKDLCDHKFSKFKMLILIILLTMIIVFSVK